MDAEAAVVRSGKGSLNAVTTVLGLRTARDSLLTNAAIPCTGTSLRSDHNPRVQSAPSTDEGATSKAAGRVRIGKCVLHP
jgi:hypothetical protein